MLRTSGKTSILLLSGPLIGKYLYILHKIGNIVFSLSSNVPFFSWNALLAWRKYLIFIIFSKTT